MADNPFDLLTQAPMLGGGGGGNPFTRPVPQGTDLASILQILAPYFQAQAQASQNFLPQLVRAKQAIAGGGRRDMAGNLINPDPVAQKAAEDALWNATFGSPENRVNERIAKERNVFKTPSDIPTFTERELAGVNARAQMRFGGRAPQGRVEQGQQPGAPSPVPTETPAPTPYTKRTGPSQATQGIATDISTPPEVYPPGPPQPASVSPAFDINNLLKPGPQIFPTFGVNTPSYPPTAEAPPPAAPWMYGVGSLAPQVPDMLNALFGPGSRNPNMPPPRTPNRYLGGY